MPRRRCVGCGRTVSRSELVRFALAGERIGRSRLAVADSRCVMPGRGAYVCLAEDGETPDPRCLELATRRGGIARTLRCAVTLDPKLVESIAR